MTAALVAFLRARYDEETKTAQGATEGPWLAEFSGETGHCVIPADAESTREYVARTQLYARVIDAEHIACWNPKRVLAEIDAKREILKAHGNGDAWCDYCAGYDDEVDDQCLTARLLALPYADHPEYRKEWRP